MKPRTAIWVVLLGLALAPAARADALGSWSSLPSMATARYGAAGAALSDGRVLVAGGIDGTGTALASAEVYDPSTGAWAPVAGMASARALATAAPLPGDRVLVVGGDVAGTPTASAEIFDGATNTWSAAAPMQHPRASATAAALPDGTVWVTGGGQYLGSEIYDPGGDSWSDSPWPLDTVGGVAVPVAGGEVFMAGGFDLDTGSVDTDWGLTSPSQGGATTDFGLWYPTYQASAATLPYGDVVMAGGSASESDPSGSTSAEIYDPSQGSSSGAWSSAASMSTSRYGAVAAPLPDGDVLIAGGEGASGPLASAEVFTAPTLSKGGPPQIEDQLQSGSEVRSGDFIYLQPGAWSPEYAPGETESLQWQRCFSSCQDVSDATAAYGYLVSAADAGATIRVVETVTWHGTTLSAGSNELGPVAVAGFHLLPGTLEAQLPELLTGHEAYLYLHVVRDDANGIGEVSYRVWDPTGAGVPAFPPATGVAVFPPNDAIAEIVIPMTVNGIPTLPAALEVQLNGGSPLGVVDPSQETVTIRDPHSPLYVRDPANPLGLPSTPPAGDPLGGAQFFADYFQSLPGRVTQVWAAGYPSAAAKVAVIARAPNVERFGAWNGLTPGWNVSTYLSRAGAQGPGTVPLISTYRLVYGHCGHWSDPPAEQAAYHAWITSLAQGIGMHPAVLFLEMDSLITEGCLSKQGVAVRMAELRDAINVLSVDPHLVTYLDAGAADALPARVAASLLRRAGIAQIQGFFLNSTHFDWTSREIRYGEKISRLTGGKHFVINTAENGQGPLRPRHPAKEGNEVLCDPAGRGLGPLPTASTGYANVDAFAWIANPGVSGGQCRAGAPPSGVFWPALALELVRHENFRVR